jgi:hypothetical protein
MGNPFPQGFAGSNPARSTLNQKTLNFNTKKEKRSYEDLGLAPPVLPFGAGALGVDTWARFLTATIAMMRPIIARTPTTPTRYPADSGESMIG